MIRQAVAIVALLAVLGSAAPGLAQPRRADDLVRYYQARVARQGDAARNHAGLGQAYILKARESGDPQYYELADAALARALDLAPDPVTAARATTDLAVVQMARHRFHDALDTARRALAYGSRELNPHGLVGDALLELGEYADAEAAYERMDGAPGRAARLSMLRFLKGDPAGAVEEMRRAARGAIEGGQPTEHVAWAQSRLGTLLFQEGDLAAAGAAHQEALATFPGYHRALAGLAQVRAAEGRYPEAIELYRRAIAVIPLPEYATGLGDVYAKVGRRDEAEKQYALVEYIGRINALNQVLYNRELALFYLDHDRKLDEALTLARRELAARRDVYTDDVLAWALYKNGQAAEAVAPMERALRLGTRDARLLFHAGMIRRAAGEPERARELLRQALAVNPRFHLFQAEAAEQALKELGEPPARP